MNIETCCTRAYTRSGGGGGGVRVFYGMFWVIVMHGNITFHFKLIKNSFAFTVCVKSLDKCPSAA